MKYVTLISWNKDNQIHNRSYMELWITSNRINRYHLMMHVHSKRTQLPNLICEKLEIDHFWSSDWLSLKRMTTNLSQLSFKISQLNQSLLIYLFFFAQKSTPTDQQELNISRQSKKNASRKLKFTNNKNRGNYSTQTYSSFQLNL